MAYTCYEGAVYAVRKRKGLQKLARVFELPADLVMDLPRITMLGNQQVLVENHRGIVEYTPSLVKINLSRGQLLVRGAQLTLEHFQAEQVLIEGSVEELRYDT